jgi:hypothetical protein
VLLVGLAGCVVGPVSVREPPASFERGVALGVFAAKEDLDYRRALAEIRATGATHVSLVIAWFQDDVAATEIGPEGGETIEDDTVLRIANEARELGLSVMIFPFLRLRHRQPGQWRGVIHPRDLDAWFDSYRRFIVHYADLAAKSGARTFSVGSELVSTEGEEARWRRLIADVRARFSGRLLYSANWDRYDHISFWDALDAIGVSAYYDLSLDRARMPTVRELLSAWRPYRDRLVAFAGAIGRPLIFTEAGYPSISGASYQPWNDVGYPDSAESQEEQRRLYEAFVRTWSGESVLSGNYFWLWFSSGGVGDRTYSPRRKAAEYVIREWYRSPWQLPLGPAR